MSEEAKRIISEHNQTLDSIQNMLRIDLIDTVDKILFVEKQATIEKIKSELQLLLNNGVWWSDIRKGL